MKKILLVEDDPFLIDIYSTKFKQMDFDVILAKDGAEALKAMERDNLDFVILDIVLPHVDGWQVLREMKKIEKKKKKKFKILILSNLGQKEEVEKGLRLGATKYLIKSDFTPSEVVQEIKKLI